MKPKTSVHCKSDVLRRAIQPGSASFKKNQLKRLSAKKKTVRFNLSTHLSTSELLLTDSKVLDALKLDAYKDQKLASKSSINIATSRTDVKPLYKLHLTSFFDQAGQWSQPSFRNNTSLGKCIHSFADLYMWEPIIRLKKNLPVKGILKNSICYDRFNNCGSYPSHSNILSAKDSFHQMSETKKHNKHCQSNFSGACDDCSMFESLASSIQGLHISAFSPGFLDPGVANVTSRQQGFTCSQIHPFPVYLPQSHSFEERHGRVSFFGLDAGNGMHPYDVSHGDI